MHPCPDRPPANCYASDMKMEVMAENTEDAITCTVNLHNSNPTENNVTVFGLKGNLYVESSRAFLRPNDQIDIVLDKTVVYPINGEPFDKFSTTVLYTTTVRQDGLLALKIKFDSMGVFFW